MINKLKRLDKLLSLAMVLVLIAGIAAGINLLGRQQNITPKALDSKVIRNGELYVNGQRTVLKTAVVLINAAVEDVRSYLPILKSKGYNAIKLNASWNFYDTNGDGSLDVDPGVTKLNALISEARSQNLFVILSLETYAVGGNAVPRGFFDLHPEAQAYNSDGQRAVDSEYSPNYGWDAAPIPSQFSPAYAEASHSFMRNILNNIDTAQILWFETTVEPQYIGNQHLDYSINARANYTATTGRTWPPDKNDTFWNQFRARQLASWINDYATVIRSIAGQDALVAADYLETGGGDMVNRLGDSNTYLQNLSGINIIQVNWHWGCNNGPCDFGYNNVAQYAAQKNWGIMEHMTISGELAPYCGQISQLLQHTINKGNKLGWEMVNARPTTSDGFTVYNNDWSPKCMVQELDNNWQQWFARLGVQPPSPSPSPVASPSLSPSPSPIVSPSPAETCADRNGICTNSAGFSANGQTLCSSINYHGLGLCPLVSYNLCSATCGPIPSPSPSPSPNPIPSPSPSPSPQASPVSIPSPSAATVRRGDVDGDGEVGVLDLGIIIEHFDEKPPRDLRADIDGDGEVSILDLGIVIEYFDR